MIKIYGKEKLLCFYQQQKDWNKGLDFLTNDSEYLQAGTWWYDEGKTLDRHYHNHHPRLAQKTNECIVVLAGSLAVNVFDTNLEFLERFHLRDGEFAVFLDGGHSYEITSDGTRVVETKNGPFPGVDIDKTRF